MFDLNPELCSKAVEHKTAFDILHAVVHYIRLHQKGFGIVGVSPRWVLGFAASLLRMAGLS
jgi:alpha-1,3-glucan synthase